MTTRRKQDGLTKVDVIVLLVLVVVLIGLVDPFSGMSRPREKARRVMCRGNLNPIGLALLQYAGDNGGFFPTWQAPGSTNFEPLNTRGLLEDGKVYACPSASHAFTVASHASFRYRGSGLTTDTANATDISMAYDQSGNHPDNLWMNALFLDGHAQGAKPDGSKGWNRND